MTIVQLTDPHIGAPWSEDPVGALEAAVAAVGGSLGSPPVAVIVTGDIASTPTEAEYEQARMVLERLGAPLYVLAGNHDDRDGLRRNFDVPEADDEFLNYAAYLGPPYRAPMFSLRSTSPPPSYGSCTSRRVSRCTS